MSLAERIFKEAQKLPDALAQEVLDFIGYIEIKHGLRDRLIEELKQAQEPAMRHVWDNQDDEVWSGVQALPNCLGDSRYSPGAIKCRIPGLSGTARSRGIL